MISAENSLYWSIKEIFELVIRVKFLKLDILMCKKQYNNFKDELSCNLQKTQKRNFLSGNHIFCQLLSWPGEQESLEEWKCSGNETNILF